MASLISKEQLAQIFGAIQSVTDTFFTMDVTLIREGESLERWNEDRVDEEQKQTQLKGMRVWGVDSDMETMRDLGGDMDLAEGYVLFNFVDLQRAGLINADGQPLINPTRDSLIVQNEEVEMIGMKPSGYLIERDALLKIYIKRKIRNA